LEYILKNTSFMGFNKEASNNVRSKLIHFEVSNNYRSMKPTLGSSYIRNELIEISGNSCHGIYSEFLRVHGRKAHAAAFRETLYEKCVLDIISANVGIIQFPCITLRSQSKSNQPMTKFVCPRVKHVKYFRTTSDIDTSVINCLWIPIASNFKGFDCLLQSIDFSLWIQITVGDKHPLSATGVHECLVKTGISRSRIVFCLPPDKFALWKSEATLQLFTAKKKEPAKIKSYLDTLPLFVLCLGADSTESEECKIMLETLASITQF